MSKIGGKIVFAGKLMVGGKEQYGFFVECNGPDVMEIQRACLLNKPITINHTERRGKDRPRGPGFHRMEPVERFPEVRGV
jgi:hypothetical protein